MADPEHVELLKQGVAVWNAWREKHPDIRPNLRRTNLCGTDLRGTNLRRTNLNSSNLNGCNLMNTDLGQASLMNVDLRGADLRLANLVSTNFSFASLDFALLNSASLNSANLSFANLRFARVTSTDCSFVNLNSANLNSAILYATILINANLNSANLNSTNFTESSFFYTTLAWVDLSNVKGLETTIHSGPSIVDIKSVILPHDEPTRLHFLRGVGFTETQIEYLPSLLMPRPIQYSSLFISYAHQDEVIAKRLHGDLREKDVPCWFAPHDMRIGDKIRPRIDESIRLHDKLLLILSQHSVASQWVEHEVETALGKEYEGKPNVLFPIRLDDAVMKSTTGWASHVRLTRHIGDFTNWQDEATYQEAFSRLLRDLKVSKAPTG